MGVRKRGWKAARHVLDFSEESVLIRGHNELTKQNEVWREFPSKFGVFLPFHDMY
jgi:hypothetical protein